MRTRNVLSIFVTYSFDCNGKRTLLKDASAEEIVNTIADLASSQEESALADLRKLLRFDLRFSGNKLVAVSRLATRALLQKGKPGLESEVESGSNLPIYLVTAS